MLIKCNRCGKVLNVIKNTDSSTICCGEPMIEIKANSVDASFEKHVPNYVIDGDLITVTVNHVMEDDHYIEWIAMNSKDRFEKVMLKSGDIPQAQFTYVPGSVVYSYCNKHGLWSKDVE